MILFLLLCHLAATTGCGFKNYCLGAKSFEAGPVSFIMYWLGLLKTHFSKAFMQVMSDASARLTDNQFFPWMLFLRGEILCSFLVLLHTSVGYIHTISGGHWHMGRMCSGTLCVHRLFIMHRAEQDYKTEF